MPRGACDTHLHVLGPYALYPLAEDRPYTAPEAPLAAMTAMLDAMNLDRAVVAHVSACGRDLRVTLDALKTLGARARGTIMTAPEISDDELRRLDSLGVRGVRLSRAFGWEVTETSLKRIADRIAAFHWHIAIWPSSETELELIGALAPSLPAEIVLDHLAGHCWDATRGIGQRGFGLLQSVLETERVWLKISGMYRVSNDASPWPDLIPFGQQLAADHAERLLWASDWPHVGVWNGNMPRSNELIDWLLRIGCDAATRRQILVGNPERLYGFAPPNDNVQQQVHMHGH